MSETVRVTVAMSPQAVDTFKQMAKVGKLSFSKCVGEWLEDTADAAQFVSQSMREARDAPKRILSDTLSVIAASKGQHVNVDIALKTSKGRQLKAAAFSGSIPPSSNYGGVRNSAKGPKS